MLTRSKVFLCQVTILAALLTVSEVSFAQNCDRSPRTVHYTGKPITVYVSPGQRAGVVFPEDGLTGADPEQPRGLVVDRSPTPNKLPISTTDPLYSGLLSVDGVSGETYQLNLLARPDCSDSLVTIKLQGPVNKANLTRDSKGRLKGLMWYLLKGEIPDGYREVDYDGYEQNNLLVFKQGSVEFYLQQQVIGPRFVGTVYQVINRGRIPFRVAIENINYTDPRVKEALGSARKVAMLPSDRILGPSPEFVSELYSDTHRGLLFIVSEKETL